MAQGKSIGALGTKVFWFGMLTFSSVLLTVANKYIKLHYPYNNSLMLLQNGLTVILLGLGAGVGVFEFKPITAKQGKIFFLSSVLLTLQIVTSLLAIDKIAIATVSIFRNLSMLTVAVMTTIFWCQHHCRNDGWTCQCRCWLCRLRRVRCHHNFSGYFWQGLNSVIYVANTFYNKFTRRSCRRTLSKLQRGMLS